MSAKLFTNVMIFDGTGSKVPTPARCFWTAIGSSRWQRARRPDRPARAAWRSSTAKALASCRVWSKRTATSPTPTCRGLRDLGDIPPEEHVLMTMHNAKSACWTAASPASTRLPPAKPRTEIVIRNEINAGRIPGPRMRAASPEITATGGLGDERQLHMYHQGIEIIADGRRRGAQGGAHDEPRRRRYHQGEHLRRQFRAPQLRRVVLLQRGRGGRRRGRGPRPRLLAVMPCARGSGRCRWR